MGEQAAARSKRIKQAVRLFYIAGFTSDQRTEDIPFSDD